MRLVSPSSDISRSCYWLTFDKDDPDLFFVLPLFFTLTTLGVLCVSHPRCHLQNNDIKYMYMYIHVHTSACIKGRSEQCKNSEQLRSWTQGNKDEQILHLGIYNGYNMWVKWFHFFFYFMFNDANKHAKLKLKDKNHLYRMSIVYGIKQVKFVTMSKGDIK